MNAVLASVQSYFSIDDATVEQAWKKTKEVSKIALLIFASVGAFWTNPSIFSIGVCVGFVKSEATKTTFKDLTDLFKHGHPAVLSVISVGAFLTVLTVIGLTSALAGGYWGSELYSHMDSARNP